jgi:putative acetyltransferase
MTATLERLDSPSALPTFERPDGQITVRHAEPEDAAALHRLFREPQVAYWTFELPQAPRASADRFVSNLGEGRYMLLACADDELVGTLGISPCQYSGPRVRHVARLGPIAVSTDWQGRGVGSMLMAAAVDLADNWLNLLRLELHVYADNAPAIALYRKYGFVVEGTHRAFGFRAGRYVDGASMARLRSNAVGSSGV